MPMMLPTTTPVRRKSLRVSLKDLFNDVVADLGGVRSSKVITIKRGTAKEDYSVPIESKERRAGTEGEQGKAVH